MIAASQFSKTDRQLMRRALELAQRACGQTRPNPLVGAVVAAGDGTVLGEGYHQSAGAPHAEVEALAAARSAGNDVRGAAIYVTLEPCNHHGKTGPCTDALIEAGVGRVVAAMRDPNPEARGGLERLRDAGIEVECGLFEEEALQLNPGFNTFHQLGRPLVTLKWAMTLDGCTSVLNGDSKWITGEKARGEVHRRRAQHDAILAGIGTVLRDDARLTARIDTPPPGPPLLRVVLDSELHLPPDSAFVREAPKSPALLFHCDEAPPARRKRLEAAGIETVVVPCGEPGLCVRTVLQHLHKRGIQSLFVEGGRAIAGSFLAAGVVDRLECWIAPKLAGGGPDHLGPIRRPDPIALMQEATNIHHTRITQYGEDFLLEGWVTEHLFRNAG